MICPKCKKTGAKYSYAYPDLIVHKCNGINLVEVGSNRSVSKQETEENIEPILKTARKSGFTNIHQTSYPTSYEIIDTKK